MTEKEEDKQEPEKNEVEDKTVTILISDAGSGQVSVQMNIEPAPETEEDYTPACHLALQLIEYLNVMKQMGDDKGNQGDSGIVAPGNDIVVP